MDTQGEKTVHPMTDVEMSEGVAEAEGTVQSWHCRNAVIEDIGLDISVDGNSKFLVTVSDVDSVHEFGIADIFNADAREYIAAFLNVAGARTLHTLKGRAIRIAGPVGHASVAGHIYADVWMPIDKRVRGLAPMTAAEAVASANGAIHEPASE